ncbi:MAG: Minf_1886 family protein [Candidatus Omnitrophota bacterium]|jgi:uncharacterized repeat protein (TIGR04138 family)
MSEFYKTVEEIYNKDKRYKPDAYEFILQGLSFTQEQLKQPGHISGKQLSLGLRDFAVNQYGAMARAVLKHWGISETRDFGNIVFNMIENKLFSKTEEDSIDDFKQVYDFETAFKNILQESIIKEVK